MVHRALVTVPFVWALAACAAEGVDVDDSGGLEIARIDGSAIEGAFTSAGSLIEFRSELVGEQRAALQLDVDGAPLTATLDLVARTFEQDGYASSLAADDVAALAALGEALWSEYPEIADSVHGTLLGRHVQRLAEAPVGMVLEHRAIDLASVTIATKLVHDADADGCGSDGVSCLPGTSGWEYGVYDDGTDGYCRWDWTPYGDNTANCPGRCGWGCNFLDNDYTWDCLDHDRCLQVFGGSSTTGNPNCTDEFWDADDDYAATYLPLCW